MGSREKHMTNYIFVKRLNYPLLISPPTSKVETQVTHLKQANRKQHSTTKQPLTKILIKKKSSYKNYTSYRFQMLLEQNQNI